MNSEGAVDSGRILKEANPFGDVSLLDVDGFDERYSINLGVTYDGVPVPINFEELPNMFIFGSTGSGKTSYLKNFVIHGLNHKDKIDLYCVSSYPTEYANLIKNPSRIASSYRGVASMIDRLANAVRKRHELYVSGEKGKYKVEDMRAIYLLMDEFASFVLPGGYNDDSFLYHEIREFLIYLLVNGPKVGLNVVCTSHILPGLFDLIPFFKNLVMVGNVSELNQLSLFGEEVYSGFEYPKLPGYGVLKVKGEYVPLASYAYHSNVDGI